MIEILFVFLMLPMHFADYNPSSFVVAAKVQRVPLELYENAKLPLERGKIIEERESDINIRPKHGSYDFLPKPAQETDGFVRALPLKLVYSEPTPLSMITDSSVSNSASSAAAFFQKNKQIAAVAGIFQLSNHSALKQNVPTSGYFGYFNTLILKMFGVQVGQQTKQQEFLPEELKQKFVQVAKGCAIAFNDDCLVARSGAGEEFEELYKLRIDILLEVDEEVENDKGEVWYKIKHEENIPHPERIKGTWFVPATHVRVVEIAEEPDFDIDKKIIVDISEQKVRAYENDELIIEADVSTGLSGRHATPIGEFDILKKQASRYMQAPALGIQDWYDLPGVPYVMYFTDSGDALHGAYWHDKFGRRWSHGCINTSYETAQLLYEWTATGTKMQVQW